MAIEEISDSNFDEQTGSGLVLVDFWAPWCAPCRMIAPALEELSKEIGDQVKITKLNVDENQQAAMKFSVTSIPTVILFKNGDIAERVTGALAKQQYKELILKNVD